ncbi:MAG TPA: protein kinase [Pyrinomonadaceae bacterium]|nr:protein kinase [Pyrinomonadaceae bacterium]
MKELFEAALELEPAQRPAFIQREGANDEDVKQEVESLLSSYEEAPSFMDTPATENLSVAPHKLSAGQRFSHYEIASFVGEGGMGEVYAAYDMKLGRKVALKFLPLDFTDDRNRVNRFVLEARAASALNHPNIITVHEIGQTDSTHYIATEFIDGVTLRRRMSEGSMPLDAVLDVAVQTASALAAAHEAGVIHRDIKPENLMLRADGYVKVLDFGLAKLTERTPAADPEGLTHALAHTAPGMVMGTASYMSPEQAAGLSDIDARTDVWSLGVVIYEMVAQRLPFGFQGATPTQIISLIIQKKAPSLKQYASAIPDELNRIVMKALENKREDRYQTMKDMLVDLRKLSKQHERETEQKHSITLEPGRSPTAGVTALRNTRRNADATGAGYLIGHLKRPMFAGAIALLIVGVALGVGFYVRGRNSAAAPDSVAVLPFDNQNRDPNTEYLSDGLTESIINSLSPLQSLRVIARSSVFRYKGRGADPVAVGRELGVRAVLTGRTLQRGDNLSVSVELIDVRDNKQLWGERYERKVTDLLAVQREIARDISDHLRLKLSGSEQARVSRYYTEKPEAYQLYLKGRYHWNKRSPESLRKAIDYFTQATALDPNYALAYTGLADAYAVLPNFDRTVSRREVMPLAKDAALKAVALDYDLAEAHTSLAIILSKFDFDWAGAERHLKRAIELNPTYPTAHQWYGQNLISQGRFDEGLAEVQRAVELDPVSLVANTALGISLKQARRYDEAIRQLQKTLELEPNFADANGFLAAAFAHKGMYEEAVAAYSRQITPEGAPPAVTEAAKAAFAKSGWQGYLRFMAKVFESRENSTRLEAIAIVYAQLGEKDKAFEWLEKAYNERADGLASLKVDPWYDPLRSDPRFTDLMHRVGLPQHAEGVR